MKIGILENSSEFSDDNIFSISDMNYSNLFDVVEFKYSYKNNIIYLDEEEDQSSTNENTKEISEENNNKDENINQDKGKEKAVLPDNIRYKPAEEGETFESRYKGKFMDRYFSDLYKKMSS